MTEWKLLAKGSKDRLLVQYIEATQDKSATTESGVLFSVEDNKKDNAEYAQLATVVSTSSVNVLDTFGVDVGHDDPMVGDIVALSPKSGRSALLLEDGSTAYVINQDEVWSFKIGEK